MRMQNAKVLLANTLNYELFQWNEKKKMAIHTSTFMWISNRDNSHRLRIFAFEKGNEPQKFF